MSETQNLNTEEAEKKPVTKSDPDEPIYQGSKAGWMRAPFKKSINFSGFSIPIGWVLLFILVIAVFVGVTAYLNSIRAGKSIPVTEEESPGLIQESYMSREIEKSTKQNGEARVSQESGEEKPGSKREFKSDIAVYVYKKDPISRAAAEKEESLYEEETGKLPSGTKVPALVEDRIFSFNMEAPVIAWVVKDISWKENIVIPKNSKFLGRSSVLKSVDRINVTFDLLITPDGKERRIRAIALSSDGSSGIRGRVKNYTDKKIFKAIGESLIGGVSLLAGGPSRDPYSLQDQMRLDLAQNLTDEARQDLRGVQAEKSITVPAFTPVQVLLLESIK